MNACGQVHNLLVIMLVYTLTLSVCMYRLSTEAVRRLRVELEIHAKKKALRGSCKHTFISQTHSITVLVTKYT